MINYTGESEMRIAWVFVKIVWLKSFQNNYTDYQKTYSFHVTSKNEKLVVYAIFTKNQLKLSHYHGYILIFTFIFRKNDL